MFFAFFKKHKIKVILFVVFIIMFILNQKTPYLADDFGYSLNLDKNHLRGLKDIINFQIIHYQWWGGRSIAHTIAQVFLLFPKIVFNVCNSICFTSFIYLVYRIGKEKCEDNSLILISTFILFYFIIPVFGQDCLWLIGSCNYLWTTTFTLLLITLYKEEKLPDIILIRIFIFLLGILAGWTNENTSFGLLIILLLITINRKIEKKGIKKWEIFGIVGNIVGFLIMILAPGNYARKSSYQEEISIIIRLGKRFLECTKGMFQYESVILFLFVILSTAYFYKKRKINKESIIFMIGSIATIYPMILSPTFPKRAWFSILTFGIISLIILLFELQKKYKKIFPYIMLDIVLIMLIIFIPDYIKLVESLNKTNTMWKERIAYIKKHPNQNRYIFPSYTITNTKNPGYEQLDITSNPKEWPNIDIERYFKIKEIVREE